MKVLGDPADGDRGRFRVLPGFGGTALFDAEFRNFVFAPHFHDTLMLGLILSGRKRFKRDKVVHEVAAGGLSIVNPGETHTGGVIGIGHPLRYTAVYPSAALLAEAGFPEGADLDPAVVDDPALRSVFARALARATPANEAEEALLMALSELAVRYGSRPQRTPAVSSTAVRRAVDYISSDLSAELRLEAIAGVAQVSPRHLIRCFQQVLSMTPQDYVRQARVREAATRLRCGDAPALTAHHVGFADQPHLTRAFRKVMGITPAAYAQSWRGRKV
jgi:AraC-like DNA-binding protein